MKNLDGKKLAVCGFIAAVALLATSCFSIPHKIVFDEEVPLEETSEILFDGGIHVLAFNGIGVDEAWWGKSFSSDESARVTIPAGEAVIDYDLFAYWSNGNGGGTTFRAQNLQTTYTFEAGKKYNLYFDRKGGFLGIGAKYGIFLTENKKEIEFWELKFN